MKLTQFKNPLTNNSGSIFDVGAWLGGILWVVMFGIIIAMGTKALNVIDNKIPGTQTPNMGAYTMPATGDGISRL